VRFLSVHELPALAANRVSARHCHLVLAAPGADEPGQPVEQSHRPSSRGREHTTFGAYGQRFGHRCRLSRLVAWNRTGFGHRGGLRRAVSVAGRSGGAAPSRPKPQRRQRARRSGVRQQPCPGARGSHRGRRIAVQYARSRRAFRQPQRCSRVRATSNMRLLDLLDGNLSRDALTSSRRESYRVARHLSNLKGETMPSARKYSCVRGRGEISGSFSPHLPTRRYCIAAPNLL
jgi:hypothetical protein